MTKRRAKNLHDNSLPPLSLSLSLSLFSSLFFDASKAAERSLELAKNPFMRPRRESLEHALTYGREEKSESLALIYRPTGGAILKFYS